MLIMIAGDIIPFLSSKAADSLDLVISADVWIYVGDLAEIFPLVAQKLRPRRWFAFSTELLAADNGFQLASSGRFQHSDRYISSLATQHGFTISVQEEIVVRKESGEPIAGRVFVLHLRP
jgi:predicted TPR repeat methyltransferase